MEVFGDRESSQVSSDNKLFELAPHPRCVHFNPNRTDADKDIFKVGLGFHQSALLLDTVDEREKHGECNDHNIQHFVWHQKRWPGRSGIKFWRTALATAFPVTRLPKDMFFGADCSLATSLNRFIQHQYVLDL